ncbi:hypothetical protein [Bacillus sp. SM2101]|uniref:hypothetical protein n=1 Tax=Bacillus sp. SM2101 TaxID=2805366 RepID=UPI001BDE6457
MILLLTIIAATILSSLLFFITGPFAMIIVSGIVLGCLFRSLYLLNDLNKRLLKIAPKTDRVKEAYERYLEEREKEKNEQGGISN